ncbi:MAG: asparagine synthase-related protein [Anaerolineae bacterium]
MPGLCGITSNRIDLPTPDLVPVLRSLSYGRATVTELHHGKSVALGCAHLGTGGQRALYKSPQAVVVFFGHLTQPPIPPGTDGSEPAMAARHIHDLYVDQGESMLDQVAGAYAFALLDRRTQTLLLVTDRLGLRPIYYAEHAGSFRFASEVKGILADPAFPRRLNRAAAADLFHFSFIMGEKTLFQDIHLLPPASVLRYQQGRWTVSRYWEIPFPEHYPRRTDRWYDDLIYEALKAAVDRMVRPGLNYGLSLSGGLDSRWIAALLAQVQPESSAFTLGTPGSDDTPPAIEVAKQTGLPHHYWELSPTFVPDLAETYMYLVDGMDHLWHMEELPLTVRVGDYADVSVGGFLGDGLFGYEINPISALLRRKDVVRYRLWRTRGGRPAPELLAQAFGERTGQELTALAINSLEKGFAEAPSQRGFQAIQYYDLRQPERRLANVAQLAKLAYVDIYHPIADQEVVQAALQLPASQLVTERAYRRAMATHFPAMAAIPWTFTLTPATISAPGVLLKKGLQLTLGKRLRGTPLGNHPWIRTRRYYLNYTTSSRGPWRSFIEDTLQSPDVNATGLFDLEGLQALVSDHMEGRQSLTTFLGAALVIALWTRLFYAPAVPVQPRSLDSENWQ